MSIERISHPIRLAMHSNRMCISMEVLHSIGSPKYIQVFVNRERKSLFIRGCVTKEAQCFTVPKRVYDDPFYDYRLNKAAFAEAICVATGWDSEGCYRLHGVPVSDRVIRFSLTEVERMD